MLGARSAIFLQFPEDHKPRILHPAVVESLDDDRLTAVAEESFLPLEVGLEVTLFYERRRQFVEQPAQIVAFSHAQPPTLVFETTGDAVSAEGRSCYRVSAALTELTCTIDADQDCPVEDVSVSGFAAVTLDAPSLGQRVTVALSDLNDREHHGVAVVQSVRETPRGYRCGFSVLDVREGGGDLQRGVSSLSLALQRRQLRRLSGTA